MKGISLQWYLTVNSTPCYQFWC